MGDMPETTPPTHQPLTAGGFDLHTHSTCSDGTDTPARIPHLVRAAGLSGFALTDHDTTAGWAEARRSAQEAEVLFLPGMEITTRFAGRSTHLLAYGFDPTDANLNGELEKVRGSRLDRAKEMVRRLSSDYDISWATVHSGDPSTTVGRPHIADSLVNAGYFASRDAAFATVLRTDSPYYVHTYAIDTARAIKLVRAAGGAAVLAHPAAARHTEMIDPASLKALVRAGLWGIELHHPENVADRMPELFAAAAAHGLWVTGSSDYHGSGKANRLGECRTATETWQALLSTVSCVV